MPLPKYVVRLTAEARTELEDLLGAGKRAASVILHARILLEADAGANGPGWDDDRIAEAMECGASTVYRVRQAWVEEGPAVSQARRRPGSAPDRAGLRRPPEGRANWTMRLPADRLVELAIVDTIGPECVRTTLEKTSASRDCESNG